MNTNTRAYGRGPSDEHLRVSDAERHDAADRLSEHFTDGRLDQAEFDERIGQAMSAKTRADLTGLFADLPEPSSSTAPSSSTTPDLPPRKHGHPALILVLVVVITLTAAHAVVQATMPWLWFAVLAAALLIATRNPHHPHPHHPHHHPTQADPTQPPIAHDR